VFIIQIGKQLQMSLCYMIVTISLKSVDFSAEGFLWCLLDDRQKKKKIPLSTLEEVDMDLCDTE